MNPDLDRWLARVASLSTLDDPVKSDEVLSDLAMLVADSSLSDSEAKALGPALDAAIEQASSMRTKASLLFVLRKVDPLLAKAVADRLLEPAVRQQRELGALLYQVADAVSIDMKLSPKERSSGLRDFEKNLQIAERALAGREVFIPW
jgi:hypothetical protein